jgi:hypothetical protein
VTGSPAARRAKLGEVGTTARAAGIHVVHLDVADVPSMTRESLIHRALLADPAVLILDGIRPDDPDMLGVSNALLVAPDRCLIGLDGDASAVYDHPSLSWLHDRITGTYACD